MIGEVAQGETQQAQTLPIPVQAQRAHLPSAGINADPGENRRLTRKERAVLRVITDPAMRETTTDARCVAANVSSSTYFRIMSDPWFRRMHREAIAAAVQEQVSTLVTAAVDTGGKPGRDGFNDRRMLLEMAGVYVPRQQVDHTTQGKPIVGVVGVSLDEL